METQQVFPPGRHSPLIVLFKWQLTLLGLWSLKLIFFSKRLLVASKLLKVRVHKFLNFATDSGSYTKTRHIRMHNTAFQAARKSAKPAQFFKYKKLRNKVVKMVKSAKSSYFKN